MTFMIVTGNLTQDAQIKSIEGRNYVLLRVAENIYSRDEKGEFIRDENNHKVASSTYFHSVFVNNGNVAFLAQNLKSGDPVKVSGIVKLGIQKDENGYDQYVLNHIVARYIDTNPFDKPSEELNKESDEKLVDIPL